MSARLPTEDLLSRLRHLADYAADTDELSDAIYEAVAEIKRLQAERDEWRRGSEVVNGRLLAEVERLRAALRDCIAGYRYIEQGHGRLPGVGWDRVYGYTSMYGASDVAEGQL